MISLRHYQLSFFVARSFVRYLVGFCIFVMIKFRLCKQLLKNTEMKIFVKIRMHHAFPVLFKSLFKLFYKVPKTCYPCKYNDSHSIH